MYTHWHMSNVISRALLFKYRIVSSRVCKIIIYILYVFTVHYNIIVRVQCAVVYCFGRGRGKIRSASCMIIYSYYYIRARVYTCTCIHGKTFYNILGPGAYYVCTSFRGLKTIESIVSYTTTRFRYVAYVCEPQLIAQTHFVYTESVHSNIYIISIHIVSIYTI